MRPQRKSITRPAITVAAELPAANDIPTKTKCHSAKPAINHSNLSRSQNRQAWRRQPRIITRTKATISSTSFHALAYSATGIQCVLTKTVNGV